MKKGNLRSSALLLLTACIWGVAFVAQSVGMEYVGPFTFNFVRSILGGLVLIPCIFFLKREKKAEAEKVSEEEKKAQRKTLLAGGICCGVALCLASNFQQIGIPARDIHITVQLLDQFLDGIHISESQLIDLVVGHHELFLLNIGQADHDIAVTVFPAHAE